MFPEKLVVGVFSLTVSLFPYNVRSISLKCEDRWNLFAFCFQEKNTLKHYISCKNMHKQLDEETLTFKTGLSTVTCYTTCSTNTCV